MGWLRLDDRYDEHPKVIAAGSEAGLIVNVRAMLYCARNETDGILLQAIVPRITSDFSPNKAKQQVKRLLEVGLWERVEGGYLVHDFLDYNPSKADRDADRAKARERMANARGNKGRSSSDVRTDVRANNGGSSGNPVPTPPLGDKETSQTALINRLINTCRQPNFDEGKRVVEALLKHVDVRVLDEAIGWVEQRDPKKTPITHPRYFLTVVTDWGKQRGVAIPDLEPEVFAR